MSRHLRLLILLCVPFASAPGCGGGSESGTMVAVAPGGAAPNQVQREAQAPAAGRPAGGEAAPVARKIIYTAQLDVVVKDLDAARAAAEKAADEAKGYIARSDVTGDAGSRRTATYVFKVPVDRFRAVVAALAGLGVPAKNAADSQDVTEEFVDIEARVRNLKAEEETLNKLLKDQAVRLDDVLKIRDQIKGVRGDIERAEGRLKYLATMAALATINVTLREEAPAYVPAGGPTPLTFGERAGRTWADSVAAVTDFAEQLALVAVALTPWLPVLAVGATGVWWLGRKVLASGGRDRVRVPVARPVAAPPLTAADVLSGPGAEPPAPAPPPAPTGDRPAG